MALERSAAAGLNRVVMVALLVFAATALGGWRVAAMTAPKPDPMTLQMGGATFTVTHVEQVAGLTDADLGGMSHGVQSLVTNDKALVRVTLTVAAGDSGTSYDARGLQVFGARSGAAVLPSGGSLGHGRLVAHARIEGTLSFVVPRKGQQLTLRAPTGAAQVPLLEVDQAPGGAPGSHNHSLPGPLHGGTSPPSQT